MLNTAPHTSERRVLTIGLKVARLGVHQLKQFDEDSRVALHYSIAVRVSVVSTPSLTNLSHLGC
jgi:hypothetical protein